jgi:hypothetical protein
MSNETGLKKLKPHEAKLFIDEEAYIRFELHRRIVYISKDSPDKRPFIYWGGVQPFNGANSKTYLETLIVGPLQTPGTKIVYIDLDLCNLKLSNITFEPKKSERDKTIDISKPSMILDPEEKEALQEAIFGNNEEKDDSSEIEESFVISNKVEKIMENVDKSRGLTPLENQYLKNGKIDSNDASKLRHSWLGVTSYETKHGTRYTATLKGVTIKSGFDHPLDAARKYNEFILKQGLPYPVNNIPGFLELEVLERRRFIGLKDYNTWELTAEVHRRIMPEEEKF